MSTDALAQQSTGSDVLNWSNNGSTHYLDIVESIAASALLPICMFKASPIAEMRSPQTVLLIFHPLWTLSRISLLNLEKKQYYKTRPTGTQPRRTKLSLNTFKGVTRSPPSENTTFGLTSVSKTLFAHGQFETQKMTACSLFPSMSVLDKWASPL